MTSSFPPAAPKQVWRNDYFLVLVDEPRRLVRNVRTARPYDSIEQLEAVMEELSRVLDGLGRSRYALLIDTRAAIGRNDPTFEATMRRLRPRWLSGFRRIGVLVQSVVGAMQIQRFAREDGFRRLITSNEAELIEYLTQGG
ncbi:hypothetical protein SOCE26_068190 [Sorangium cellulosum]|uniref:STAS/SEC14 domain-containing protein n=1 Tax=Sorangium cellulosum TaxID=56 RepID=A0A2L0F1C5_SORCE|nr:hypothetical protein [Sorangium cellulosum]AUX45337.1 hypothetical protein SOCE26_068190 [Sorangium cellulosum]